MKIAIIVAVSIAFGYAVGHYGPHKMIDQTSKGFKATSKAIDSVNKKIAQ